MAARTRERRSKDRDLGMWTGLFKKLLKGLQYVPRVLVTDKLKSYGTAKREILPGVEHRQNRYLNNRASLFGRLVSSAFRLSDPDSSNCPAGSCFSSESAPRPLHDGVRRMRRNDLRSVLLRP